MISVHTTTYLTHQICPRNASCEDGSHDDRYCHYCLIDASHYCRFRMDVTIEDTIDVEINEDEK